MTSPEEEPFLDTLKRLMGDTDNAFFGTVLEVEGDLLDADSVRVEIHPLGNEVSARVVYIGAGRDRGFLHPVEVDDQVVVLVLDGNPDTCVVLAGFYGGRCPSVQGEGYTLLHPNGTRVQNNPAGTVQPVVLSPLPADLQDGWETLINGLNDIAASPAVTGTAPQNAAAILDIKVRLATLAVQLQQFNTLLQQPNAYLSGSLSAE